VRKRKQGEFRIEARPRCDSCGGTGEVRFVNDEGEEETALCGECMGESRQADPE